MGDGPAPRFHAQALHEFAAGLLVVRGLAPERAAIVAETLLEADLMGYRTHGLARLPVNLDWLASGEMRSEGEPIVIRDRGSNVLWDAQFLPGPWVVHRAIGLALERVESAGVATVVIRRAQHAACLAAYLRRATEAGKMILMAASTPAERVMAPFGGVTPQFSTNPLAVGLPTSTDPLLIDSSMTIVSLGAIAQARAAGARLPSAALLRADGTATNDPAEFEYGSSCTLLPVGGLDHGHKGYALSIMVEALSAALGGYGRAQLGDDDEANSLFIQILDPGWFGGTDAFRAHMDELGRAVRESPPAPGEPPVRLPGDRALALRRHQLRHGVEIGIDLRKRLEACAAELGVPMPLALEDRSS